MVATHSDEVNTNFKADTELLERIKDEFGHIFHLEEKFFRLDAHSTNSKELKELKQTLAKIKGEIVEASDEIPTHQVRRRLVFCRLCSLSV